MPYPAELMKIAIAYLDHSSFSLEDHTPLPCTAGTFSSHWAHHSTMLMLNVGFHFFFLNFDKLGCLPSLIKKLRLCQHRCRANPACQHGCWESQSEQRFIHADFFLIYFYAYSFSSWFINSMPILAGRRHNVVVSYDGTHNNLIRWTWLPICLGFNQNISQWTIIWLGESTPRTLITNIDDLTNLG